MSRFIIPLLLIGAAVLINFDKLPNIVGFKNKSAFDPLFEKYGAKYNINPTILKAIATKESSLNPNADNPRSSAKGLMQVVDGTALQMGELPAKQYDPETSIRTGAKYLRWMMDNYSFDIQTAIRGYYAGPGTVRVGDSGGKFSFSWQPESYRYAKENYLPAIIGYYSAYGVA